MIRVTFLIDGEGIQAVNWPTVPRPGEHVRFSPFAKPRLAVVVDVVYWQGPDNDCRADVVCEYVTQ